MALIAFSGINCISNVVQPSPFLFLKLFHHLKQKPNPLSKNSPSPPAPQPLVTSHLLPVSINLSVLGILYKYNHTVLSFGVSGLFHNVIKVHLQGSMYPSFIPSYGHIIAHCPFMPHFVHSSVDRHLGCCHLSDVMNNAAMNVGRQASILASAFSSFGCIKCMLFCDQLLSLVH